MVGPLWLIDIGIASISAILLAVVLASHLRSWRDARSRILMGASIFILPLLVANIAAAYFDYLLAQHFGAEVAIPILMVEILQVAGYSIFFAISWKY